jgi:NAD(P) transhydrogenase subunit alpha
MVFGVPKETYPGEKRVAMIPAVLPALKKLGLEVWIESGAGAGAYMSDEDFRQAGAQIASSRQELLAKSDIVAYVRAPGADKNNLGDLAQIKKGAVLLGHTEPFASAEIALQIAKAGLTSFSLELVPRITRAQSMDVLSSMASMAGYRAVLLAATHFGRIFPMYMTAAGTLLPAKVFIVGVGVAGLQAIAVSRKLGAQVEAYDVRAAVKEQVQSLGAKFVELSLDTGDAQDKGGYAKALDEDKIHKQQELMATTVAGADIVITTAAVPGKKSPILITKAMVEGMKPGSVIVDIAAEKGGNVELTRAGETVEHNGVSILGLVNAASDVAIHASQMYANNVKNFLALWVKNGALAIDPTDEIIKATLVTQNGEIVHPQVKAALGQ